MTQSFENDLCSVESQLSYLVTSIKNYDYQVII